MAGGGPKSLRLLLEGESLLNDASSITLFTIFLSQVENLRNGISSSGAQVLGNIVKEMLWLAVGAFPLSLPPISQTKGNQRMYFRQTLGTAFCCKSLQLGYEVTSGVGHSARHDILLCCMVPLCSGEGERWVVQEER
jgi:hypothetical protein